jgi:hypothetical protein
MHIQNYTSHKITHLAGRRAGEASAGGVGAGAGGGGRGWGGHELCRGGSGGVGDGDGGGYGLGRLRLSQGRRGGWGRDGEAPSGDEAGVARGVPGGEGGGGRLGRPWRRRLRCAAGRAGGKWNETVRTRLG